MTSEKEPLFESEAQPDGENGALRERVANGESEAEADTVSTLAKPLPSDAPLSQEEEMEFQLHLWTLLERRSKLYTGGESSSIPEVLAHQLLSSISYLLDIDLNDLSPVRVRELLASDINEVFEGQLEALGMKLKQIPDLWKEVCLTTPLFESIALKDTLESLRDFTKNYDYRYAAHEIPCDIDYPLCHAVPDSYQGASYVVEYLETLRCENVFMQQFDHAKCRRLLKTIHPDYRVLILNLYEPIACNVVGLALAEEDIFGLNCSDEVRLRLEDMVRSSSRSELMECLVAAAAYICQSLEIKDERLCRYLQITAESLCPRMRGVFKGLSLEGVFISIR